ncbi:MAG TPA: hypothetical protein VFB42_06745 [Gaiellaceae bacterium]|nr:hypothetical protein [Gaiellaceae bacterium]
MRTLVLLAALGGAFAGGIGLGEALHERPEPGGTQVLVRTLSPLQLPPIPPKTGAATATGP